MASSETWRLLITPPQPGAVNMAIDRAIADCYPQHQQSTLRFYSWSPPCVSIGYGQRLQRDVNQDACAFYGIDIVRRPTGGRAILHDHEVTYSLVTSTDHPLLHTTSVVQSYLAISQALCYGLRLLGITSELAPRPAANSTKSAACFDLPGDYEITVGGRKLIGSAQARKQGVLLQHGTLLLHADVDLLTAVLRLPPTLEAATLAQRLVALDEVLPDQPRYEDVMAALIQGFEAAWKIRLVPGQLTANEQVRAEELTHTTFGNPAWTARR